MKPKSPLFYFTLLIYLGILTALGAVPHDNTLPRGVITQFNPGSPVYTIAFSPNGRVLASGDDDNAVILWNIAGKNQVKTFIDHKDWVKSVAFSSNGKILASASYDGFIKLRELIPGSEKITTLKHGNYVTSVAFSPDSKILASAGSDGAVRLWDISKTLSITTFTGHSGGVSSVAFSPNGETLASVSYDGALKMWSINGSEIKSLIEKGPEGLSVTFSPDGSMLASSSKGNTIQLWETPSGKAIAFLKHDYVESVAFSPDGKMLASASADSTVKLWGIPSQTELISLKGHRNRVTSVVFSPDGKTLASGSRDGTILVWDLSYFDIENLLVANASNIPDSPKIEKLKNPISSVLQDFLEEPGSTTSKLEEPGSTTSKLEEPGSTTSKLEEPGSTTSKRKNLPLLQEPTPPTIYLNIPPMQVVRSTVENFTIQGSVTDDNGIDKVKVNGKEVTVTEKGKFNGPVRLNYGNNEITVTATDVQGNIAKEQLTIIRPNIASTEQSPIIQPNSDTTPPNLFILSPAENVVPPAVKQITVAGIVSDENGIYKVQVNGDDATVVEKGGFNATVPLHYGDNIITITATDTKFNITKKQVTITRNIEKFLSDTIGPTIHILTPIVGSQYGSKVKTQVTTENIHITGTVTDPSGIYGVKVNGTEVPVLEDRFTTTVQLVRGDNLIHVEAIDTLQNASTKEFTVVYATLSFEKQGKDYALLFVTESYDHWNNLHNLLFDAQAIQTALQKIYGFQVELIRNPTQADILRTLRNYAQKDYTPEDQLFIFFTGHGYFDTTYNMGYLVARDTKMPENDSEMISYLPHSEFRDLIDRMHCKHIFLVLNTCYIGAFDQQISINSESEDTSKSVSQADIEQKLKYTTRWYLTSGAKKQISEGIPVYNSPFIRAFLKALNSEGGIDHLLTIEEILTHCEKLDNPKPCSAKFGRNEHGSDFLFITK